MSRARLANLSAELHRSYPRARRPPDDNLHLTLAFIGELDAAIAPLVAQRLNSIRSSDEPWRIDTVGSFEGAHVLWAGGEPSAALADLAAHARSALAALKVPFDAKPFTAHITLLRNFHAKHAISTRRPIVPPIEFELGQPELIVSTHHDSGVFYRSFSAG